MYRAAANPGKNQTKAVRLRQGLPEHLQPLFWDYDFNRLRWESDRQLVTRRVLESGTWSHIQWLRRKLGDDALRDWIIGRRGAGLSPPQLRFWELVLGIPRKQVNTWLTADSRLAWDGRRHS